MRFNVAVAALLALACASSSPDLPKCPPVEEMQPLPSERCRSESDFVQFQRQLAAVVEDNASPLLVRIEFDSQSVVQKICADPTSARGYARARKQLATRFSGVPLERLRGLLVSPIRDSTSICGVCSTQHSNRWRINVSAKPLQLVELAKNG
jgi:hypothetical protein